MSGQSRPPRPPRFPLRDRLRYRVDDFLSRGPAILIGVLFGATLLAVLFVAVVITLVGWGAESGFNFLDVIWRAFLTTLDPGTVANFLGGSSSPGYLSALLIATLFGIFVTSILIGILVTALQSRLEELRKGHSTVIETGHTVILGWSPQVFTIIAELVVANANQPRRAIVVLAPRDKVEMEDEISGAGRPDRPHQDRVPGGQPHGHDGSRPGQHRDREVRRRPAP